MLKSATPSQHRYTSPQVLMSGLSVEEYIKELFFISPKKLRGTASAREWLDFIERYNHYDGQVVLNQAQRKLIEPYCAANDDLEMTPEDFIRLIHLVRDHNKQQPQVSVSTPSPSSLLFSTSRPRSSKVVNDQPTRSSFGYSQKRLNRIRSISRHDYTTDFYDEPEPLTETHGMIDIRGPSDYKREKSIAKKEREHQNIVSNIEKEYNERIEQLKLKIESLQTQVKHQKSIIADQRNKELDTVEKIRELEEFNKEYEHHSEMQSKSRLKKQEELEKITEKLYSLQERNKIYNDQLQKSETELNTGKETIKTLQRQVSDQNKIYAQLQDQLGQAHIVQQDLEDEKTKLMEIIDKQKFDLDEARSGLTQAIYNDSIKSSNSNNNSNFDKSSFVSEQVTVIEKGYKDQIDHLQAELDRVSQSYETRLSLMSEEYNKYRNKWADAEIELEKMTRRGLSHEQILDGQAPEIQRNKRMLKRMIYWITFILWGHLLLKIFLSIVPVFFYPTTHKDEYYSEMLKSIEFWFMHYVQNQERSLR